jgi:polysaccharide pyruvyl transferase WcaK-like protein
MSTNHSISMNVTPKTAHSLTRRQILAGAAAVATAAAATKKKPVILLRSSWQTVNIGDIAHTPGMLEILKAHVPECSVILWPGSVDRGVRPMLLKAFPTLRILADHVAADDPTVKKAIAEASLFLHGSAKGISAGPQVEVWRKSVNKPFGFYGVGVELDGKYGTETISPRLRPLVDDAAFFYTRETASLANLKKIGAKARVLGFTPDATFSFDLLDNDKAAAYMRDNRLQPRKFLVAIPRLRYTPYNWNRKVIWSPEETKRRMSVNDKYKETDHAKMREAITAWVRKTGNPVVVCPEMTYQIDIMDELVFNPLPADVKPHVILRKRYWLPDEATSFYAQAASVLSYECHSPILAVTRGTPCFYVHQPEDGIKGHMWKDVGLSEWYYEIDDTTGAQLAEGILKQFANLPASIHKSRQACTFTHKIHKETSGELRRVLGLGA